MWRCQRASLSSRGRGDYASDREPNKAWVNSADFYHHFPRSFSRRVGRIYGRMHTENMYRHDRLSPRQARARIHGFVHPSGPRGAGIRSVECAWANHSNDQCSMQPGMCARCGAARVGDFEYARVTTGSSGVNHTRAYELQLDNEVDPSIAGACRFPLRRGARRRSFRCHAQKPVELASAGATPAGSG
jgi:hypothetical protein